MRRFVCFHLVLEEMADVLIVMEILVNGANVLVNNGRNFVVTARNQLLWKY